MIGKVKRGRGYPPLSLFYFPVTYLLLVIQPIACDKRVKGGTEWTVQLALDEGKEGKEATGNQSLNQPYFLFAGEYRTIKSGTGKRSFVTKTHHETCKLL